MTLLMITWLTVEDLAQRWRKCHETIRRGAREGTIPANRNGGQWRFHPDDIRKEEEKQRVEPLNELYEQLPDETRAALIKALPRLRREVPAAIPAFFAALRYDVDRLGELVLSALAGAVLFLINNLPGLGHVELVGAIVESEVARRERLHESSRRVRGGVGDLWSGAHVVDVATWKLLEPTLNTGVKWITAQRPLLFRLRRGDPQSFSVFKDAPVPITTEIFTVLLENSGEFRAALGRGDLREIAGPAK